MYKTKLELSQTKHLEKTLVLLSVDVNDCPLEYMINELKCGYLAYGFNKYEIHVNRSIVQLLKAYMFLTIYVLN